MSICTKEWFRELVSKHHQMAKDDQVYVLGIFRKADYAHIGSIGFSTIMRENLNGLVLVIQFTTIIGEKTINAALNLAFNKLNYHRIEAHINLDNIASIKLVESVGIVYECIRKGFIYENEKWTDHLVYYKNKN